MPVFFAQAEHFDANYFEEDPVNFYFQIGDVDDDGDPEWLQSGSGQVRGDVALGDKDPRMIASSVINLILGFLGIIALILVLVSGFKYMVSGGNEDVANAAKKILYSGIIGLILVLASYGIARFLISSLYKATS